LEAIRDHMHLRGELANIITLLDDERYARYDVKILIVGIPADLRKYFLSTPNLTTVGNRLREIPEVSRMTETQCAQLVRTGFMDKLRYSVYDADDLAQHTAWVTDRLPQRLHEYCLELAFLCEGARAVAQENLDDADRKWLAGSLSASYAVIESVMNERDTKVGRRNQTLFSLGSFDREEFRWSDIEAELRKNFPVSTHRKTLNISQILSGLASGHNPIIRRSPKGDTYTFSDPKYRMCLRLMLEMQESNETVQKVSIEDAN
jgi:hypothetical protein